VIGVTGASGYVGGRILAHLRRSGFETVAMVRRPARSDARARPYALAQSLDPSLLDGVEWVVHAAHDLSQVGDAVRVVNCEGSLPLLDALAERGGRAVLISSLSAFSGARSDYGRAKLELEHAVLERNGVVLRPGLVFGVDAGGLFGAIARATARYALMPMVGSGRQRLFMTHDRAVCELVSAIVAGDVPPDRPLFAAHEVPATLRDIAQRLARANGRDLTVIPLAPRLVYLGLRSAELARLPLPFRSDSLRSLSHPIPLDQVAALARGPVEFPPLSDDLWRS
jgi:nucleoside-diphosphate-sugar epimerase